MPRVDIESPKQLSTVGSVSCTKFLVDVLYLPLWDRDGGDGLPIQSPCPRLPWDRHGGDGLPIQLRLERNVALQRRAEEGFGGDDVALHEVEQSGAVTELLHAKSLPYQELDKRHGADIGVTQGMGPDGYRWHPIMGRQPAAFGR